MVKGEFRLNAKKLLLTYPKNDTSKEECEVNLKEYFQSNLEGYSIGQETHADGKLHLHIVVLLKEKCDVKNAKALDFIANKHGNYVTCKRPKNCIEYTMKEDKEPIQWGTVLDILKTGAGKFQKVAKLIQAGKRYKDLLEEEQGFVLQNKRKIDEFISLLDSLKPMECDIIPYGWQIEVLERLYNQDSRQILWIVDGEGNNGKSHLARYLESQGAFRTGAGKIENIAYLYGKEDIVVFDYERADQEKVQYGMLEQFKNGTIVSTKYTPQKKYKQASVIVLANWEPKRDALSLDRWDIYTLTEGKDYIEKEINFHQ